MQLELFSPFLAEVSSNPLVSTFSYCSLSRTVVSYNSIFLIVNLVLKNRGPYKLFVGVFEHDDQGQRWSS